jgi:trimeric autotransporter adhesin
MNTIIRNLALVVFLFSYSLALAQHQDEGVLSPERIKIKQFKQHQRFLINNSAFIDPVTGLVQENAHETLLKESLEVVAAQKQAGTTTSSALANLNWVSRGPNNRSGYTSAVAFDPNDPTGKKAWAGGQTGGLWFNNDVTDANSPWQLASSNWPSLGIADICFDASNPQHIYVSAGRAGLYKSTDAGQTWNPIPTTATLADGTFNSIVQVTDLIVVSSTEIYAGTLRGVLKSTDGGANWTRILLPQAVPNLIPNPVGPPFSSAASGSYSLVSSLKRHKTTGELFAAFGCGEVFRSSDGGATWTNFYALTPLNKNYTLVGLSQSTSGGGQVVYVIGAIDSNSGSNSFAKTTNNGSSWTNLAWPAGMTNLQLWRNFMLEVHPNKPDVVWAGTQSLRQSINGGQTFTGRVPVSMPVGQADYHRMVFSAVNPNNALIGNDQGICYWTDVHSNAPIGNTRYNGYNTFQSYNVAIPSTAGSDLMLAVAQDQSGIRLNAPGFSGATNIPSGEGYFVEIDQDQPDIAYYSVFGGGRLGYIYNTQTQQNVKQLNFGPGYSDSPNIYNSQSNTLLVFNSFDQNVPGRVHFSVVNNVSTTNSPSTNVLSTMFVDGIFAANGTAITGYYEHTRAMTFGHDPNTVFLFAFGGGGAKGQGLVFKITQFFSGSPVVQRINTNQVMGIDSHCIAVGQNDDELLVTIDGFTTAETLWYTNNGGQTWTGLKKPNGGNVTTSGLPKNYSALTATFNPVDYKQVLLGSWDGVWSCDDITTPNLQWTYSSNGLGAVETRDIDIRPSDGRVVAATFGRGIFSAELLPSSAPVAGFTANQVSGCVPLTVQFNNASTGTITGYNWSFPGGTPSSSTVVNPTVTYSAPGLYDAELMVTGPGGTNILTQSQFIQVGAYPTAGFTYTINGNMVSFTGNMTHAVGILWNFGDGNTSTAANPVHTYTQGGSYTVSVQVSNNCGQAFYSAQVVIQTVLPVANFTVSAPSGCTPLTVMYTSTSSNAASHSWSFPGGSPSVSFLPNPTVIYYGPGTYNAALTVYNGANSDTKLITGAVVVSPAVGSNFTYSISGPTVTFNNLSSNATGYAWNFGDGSIGSNAANPTYTYAMSGTYTVTLVAGNSCGSTPFSQTITISSLSGTGGELPSGMSVKMYPNPSQGQFTLEIANAPTKQWKVHIFNGLGQKVLDSDENIADTQYVKDFTISNAIPGLYRLQLINGQHQYSIPFVVHR